MKFKTALLIGVQILFLFACSQEKIEAYQFKQGTFKIPSTETYKETLIIRKDSFQIEQYENQIDTLLIKWDGNFKYTLQMLHPKTDLDKNTIHVKITAIKKNNCDFIAKMGYSNFEQKGTLYKIPDQTE